MADLAAAALLRGEFTMEAFDMVITAAYNPSNPHRAICNTCLMTLQSQYDTLWIKADSIIDQSTSTQGKFFGLQILDTIIKTKWKILPTEQREGIKNYIVGKVIAMSQSEESIKEKVFMNKLNITLIEIVKQEWPHNWPTFISDLVNSSRTSEVLCENNMVLLKLLSEEIFDFSKDAMIIHKIKTLKESLNNEFTSIYHLCEYVIEHSTKVSLLVVTLQTLQRFLTWIPLGFIFQTNIIDILINRFFPVPVFRNEALDCLTEIGNLTELEPQ